MGRGAEARAPPLPGDRVRLEPLEAGHADDLFSAAQAPRADPRLWDFLPYGPFMVIKGGNRDTARYSILDQEWPAARRAVETWLEPANFDADGRQRQGLAELRGRPAGSV